MTMHTVGQALVTELKKRDVSVVFGIPGVHTIELYRGLAASGIRHVTPRHEQGAGFMADGYARASGKPGVAFVITGPGLTNILTPMAQARADSVPMLVVSGVNASNTLGLGMGHLHELPDQLALSEAVALVSEHISKPEELNDAIERAFTPFSSGRPGPTHIEIPLDIAGQMYEKADYCKNKTNPLIDDHAINQAAEHLRNAQNVVILAGGGAKHANRNIKNLAERLDAPVVQTVNARGLLHADPLAVPASPSLKAVRNLIEQADCVLAIGTEFGPTDYDMYATGEMAKIARLIRIDLCPKQLGRHEAELSIRGDSDEAIAILLEKLPKHKKQSQGAVRAKNARHAALEEIGPEYREQLTILNAIRDEVPNAFIIGDSTQPIYAGNLYYDHDRPGGWFNAATGYGALGYAIPASIGAAIAAQDAQVICITGDGGAQFSIAEIMAAVDQKQPVIFIIWNNYGYKEISTSMQAAKVDVVGCDPSPPDFAAVAASFGIPFRRTDMDPKSVSAALAAFKFQNMPSILEIEIPGPANNKG